MRRIVLWTHMQLHGVKGTDFPRDEFGFIYGRQSISLRTTLLFVRMLSLWICYFGLVNSQKLSGNSPAESKFMNTRSQRLDIPRKSSMVKALYFCTETLQSSLSSIGIQLDGSSLGSTFFLGDCLDWVLMSWASHALFICKHTVRARPYADKYAGGLTECLLA